jgi:quercetin dioxygenase-like cupin family protein
MAQGVRVFLRGITSESYGLKEFRDRQLAAPRVREEVAIFDAGKIEGSGDVEESQEGWWKVGPGDDPFLTQSLQVHFVRLPPGGSNHGHGHQNEAAFYILEGRGYEVHDDHRYDWEKGDLVLVHTDSVHRHFNPYQETATAIVIKAKSAWMYLGMLQQGRSAPFQEADGYGPRQDWTQLWTPGVESRKKVIKPADTSWELSPLGRVRVMSSPARTDVRTFSVDTFELAIEPGGHSGRRWQMADEILYVLSGSGYSLHLAG